MLWGKLPGTMHLHNTVLQNFYRQRVEWQIHVFCPTLLKLSAYSIGIQIMKVKENLRAMDRLGKGNNGRPGLIDSLPTSMWHLLLTNCFQEDSFPSDRRNGRWSAKHNTHPPSKILIRAGSPRLDMGMSSSGFPLFSSSFSVLISSFRPSLGRSEGRWTYLAKGWK